MLILHAPTAECCWCKLPIRQETCPFENATYFRHSGASPTTRNSCVPLVVGRFDVCVCVCVCWGWVYLMKNFRFVVCQVADHCNAPASACLLPLRYWWCWGEPSSFPLYNGSCCLHLSELRFLNWTEKRFHSDRGQGREGATSSIYRPREDTLCGCVGVCDSST